MATEFEWDESKSQDNLHERGFDFSIVEQFNWETVIYVEDDRFDYGETRYRAYARLDGKPYCTAFTLRDGRIRIISVRRMREKEAKRYGI